MKKVIFPALLAVLVFGACSTDFELEAPWKDIPVVYGFLNLQDTAHYIRVEKAFLEPGGNANSIAQIVDSLYYNPAQITVQLQRRSTGQRFTLQRVDGNAEGYPRQSGPFAQAPNYLYKIRASALNLVAEQDIRLIIERGNGLPSVIADATVLGPLTPRPNLPADPLNLDYTRTLVFLWDVPVSGAIFDIRMNIHYREEESAGNFVLKTLEWTLKRDIEKAIATETSLRFDQLKGEDFYRFVGSSLPNIGNRRRIFDSVDIVYTAGGSALRELIRVEQANTGITSSQSIPVYTNLSEGRGVFSSRTQARRTGITLNGPSLDSLRFGIHTRQLNFQ